MHGRAEDRKQDFGSGVLTMRAKDRKWLELIALASKPSRSMYRGERIDIIPDSVVHRLCRDGFAYIAIPNNLVHKDRVVITDAGLAALED